MAIYETEYGIVISSRQVWLPGVYDSKRAANYAFKFTDEELNKLQKEVKDGLITFEMLQELHAKKVAKEDNSCKLTQS